MTLAAITAAIRTKTPTCFLQRACKETYSFLPILSSKGGIACSVKLIPL